jgi:DNA-binding MarR family transcriptional regulator
MSPSPTLGTLLRHLIEYLDGAVEDAYRSAGLAYKPRYTPVVRALQTLGPSSIRAVSRHAGITHSAASQTVTDMAKHGLLTVTEGTDARERIIALSPAAEALLPKVKLQWEFTEAAARSLDAELGLSLPDVLQKTLTLLAERSFSERIAAERKKRKTPMEHSKR